jgi:IS4 transposase
MYSNRVDKATGVRYDQIGKLVTPKSLKEYPDKIRKITFHDKEQNCDFVFLTNNFELKAIEIALLYKKR